MIEPRHYSKQLTKITSVRLSPSLLADGSECASNLGMSFSDFLRQSLTKNIKLSPKSGIKASKCSEDHSS